MTDFIKSTESYNISMAEKENIEVLQKINYNGLSVEVLEYKKMLGSRNPELVNNLWFMEQQNLKPRQVVFYLNNDAVKTESGNMSYFQGKINVTSGITIENAVSKVFKGVVTGEPISKPIYRGTGTLVLEPTFKYLVAFVLAESEKIIVDKSMFYASSESVKTEPFIQKNVSSALLGNEGLFQTSLTGPGVVVLELPVPMCEVNIINLQNDTLKVDGNFALLRTGDIEFTVEKTTKSIVGSAVSKEGLVNVYKGTGQVWLSPTLKIYDMIQNCVEKNK